MKRTHLLPNMITAFSLCCGLFVIFKASMSNLGDNPYQTMTTAAGILLLAAIADFLDGAIARAMGVESQFGGFFDSLSDSITFGVAPVVVLLKNLALEPGDELTFFLVLAAMIYSVCGVLRLVRYNVMSLQKEEEDVLTHFTGLPIPAGAAAILSGNLFLYSQKYHFLTKIGETAHSVILFVMLLLVGYLMISRWKFPSLKKLRIRVGSFQSVFLITLLVVGIFYGVFRHFALVFALISWTYIAAALALAVTSVEQE